MWKHTPTFIEALFDASFYGHAIAIAHKTQSSVPATINEAANIGDGELTFGWNWKKN